MSAARRRYVSGTRRILWPIVALAFVTGAAVPGPAAAQAPAEDSVFGLGVAENLGAFEFAVRSGPSGETPSGQAAIGPLRQSPIACLAVTGNVARIDVVAGRITVNIEVTDNAGRGVPDTVRGSSDLLTPANCAAPLSPVVPANVVVDGDIVVVDASPRPVTKRDCKRDGWRRFGFENKRQCIRSVKDRPPS